MKRRVLVNILFVLAILSLSFVPLTALAEEPVSTADSQEELVSTEDDAVDAPTPNPQIPKAEILITEVQTSGSESGTSAHEFIELYNATDNIVDLTGWQIIYINSSDNESLLYEFNDPLLFLPDTFIMGKLLGAPADFMPDELFDFEYEKGSTGMAATEGGIRLIDTDDKLISEVSWTSASSSDKEEVVLSLTGGKTAQRYKLDGELLEDELIANRYTVDEPTPRNFLEKETAHPDEDEDSDEELEIVVDDIVAPPAPEPISNPKIYLNELLPDPASPQKDSQDEFIELYNPNNQKLDISGYTIIAKTSRESTYSVPKNTFISAKGYYYVTSAVSPIALNNAGAKLTLVDNLGRQIDSISYGESDSGQAWAKAGGKWQWTITPTMGKANIITTPIVVVKASKTSTSKTTSKKSSTSSKTNFANNPKIIINEIFPDPKSPLKDSQDEFIELYNPNSRRLNIADYVITSGATRIYKHTLPAGASIEPKGYYTVTSADTSLALTNSGGTVTLTDNLGKKIDSVDYAGVVAGQSWAFVGGKWQWTATPTKNSANNLSAVPATGDSSSTESTTEVAGATVAGTEDTPVVAAPQPLPGWLLAVIGVGTVCYAAYEYRFEARNYYYKYQRIRSAR